MYFTLKTEDAFPSETSVSIYQPKTSFSCLNLRPRNILKYQNTTNFCRSSYRIYKKVKKIKFDVIYCFFFLFFTFFFFIFFFFFHWYHVRGWDLTFTGIIYSPLVLRLQVGLDIFWYNVQSIGLRLQVGLYLFWHNVKSISSTSLGGT